MTCLTVPTSLVVDATDLFQRRRERFGTATPPRRKTEGETHDERVARLRRLARDYSAALLHGGHASAAVIRPQFGRA